MFAVSGNTRLYWESAGSGQPLLLVMGLGMAATGWWRTIPALAKEMRVISFDNRGVGRSDQPRGRYTMAQMAEDAMTVLDAANVADASIYGISMGGMIAQELALRHPERVRALVLGATTAGGPKQTLPETEVLDFLRRRPSLPAEEAAWASVPYLYSRATREKHTVRIGEDVVQRLRFPPTRDGYLAQAGAVRWHNTNGRLGSICTPTLVLHGTEDQIVPRVNGERLVESIPSARLEILEDAGHLYPTDAPEAAHTVLRFLLG